MKLLLFDIDGTITKTGAKGHKTAFKEAIEKVYEVSFDINTHYPGSTDKQIIYEELKRYGLTESEIEPKIKDCMNKMENIFKNYDNSDLVAIDHIEETLEKLSHNHGVLIGLLTGNVEGIAYEKMRILGLKDYFKIGGFGSDPHEKRSDLIKVAKEKAENLGHKIDETYVIGDTPLDIKAGKEAKAKTIAVATGIYSVNELRKYSPDYLFEKLKANELMKTIGV